MLGGIPWIGDRPVDLLRTIRKMRTHNHAPSCFEPAIPLLERSVKYFTAIKKSSDSVGAALFNTVLALLVLCSRKQCQSSYQ
jgi:hypothetical protein